MARKIGIIGGSGLEDPALLRDPVVHTPITPYGDPSSPLLEGKIDGVDIVILSRHGNDHSITPTQVKILEGGILFLLTSLLTLPVTGRLLSMINLPRGKCNMNQWLIPSTGI
jgi:hypothetical protein